MHCDVTSEDSAADQVVKARAIAESLSRTVATPTEARERLGLEDGDRVGF